MICDVRVNDFNNEMAQFLVSKSRKFSPLNRLRLVFEFYSEEYKSQNNEYFYVTIKNNGMLNIINFYLTIRFLTINQWYQPI